MNIKINKTEHEYLQDFVLTKFVVGSRMYGTANEESDTDYLCIYTEDAFGLLSSLDQMDLPNIHQFQYDDKEGNAQYIYTTKKQFFQNLCSGDSTINAEVIMFGDGKRLPVIGDPLKLCRTYNIIKAYIGFAKRDLKTPSKKNKMFHAYRSLYFAESLMDNRIPLLKEVNLIKNSTLGVGTLILWESNLRKRCNKMYDYGELKRYYIPTLPKSLHPWNTLGTKLLNSNNTKEFKYE